MISVVPPEVPSVVQSPNGNPRPDPEEISRPVEDGEAESDRRPTASWVPAAVPSVSHRAVPWMPSSSGSRSSDPSVTDEYARAGTALPSEARGERCDQEVVAAVPPEVQSWLVSGLVPSLAAK